MAKRFLIVRLSSLGDVVHTLPVANSLKQAHMGCHITWMVDPRFASIVRMCMAVDEVIEAKPGLVPSSWPNIPGSFDAALDMQGLFKSAIVVGRAKAAQKVGYHWQREGARLFSSPVLPDPSSLHIVDQYVDVARALGGSESVQFSLTPSQSSVEAAKSMTSEQNGPLVILNAGAGWATKRWPIDACAALLDGLHKEGACGVLIGGKAAEDLAISQEIRSKTSAPYLDLVGKTSIADLIALIWLARAHVGGDTGSSHLAAALGVPAIGLYSITRPERSCPYGQIGRCLYNKHSLANIKPDEVLKKVMESLA